jgi:hypothetical protein
MITKYALVGCVLAALLCVTPVTVNAQEVPHVVSATLPVSSGLRGAVDDWLATAPPSSAVYYGITYVKPHGVNKYYVCIVGLNITAPDQAWSFTGDEDGNSQVVWSGTVIVTFLDDGSSSVEMYANDPVTTAMHSGGGAMFAPILFAPSYGAGGGPYVRFPWQASRAVKIGVLGLHYVGYGNDPGDDWRALDLVSGSNFGSGAANDSVYASVAGTVDYVCEDSMSTAIRVSGDGDSFVYAHMLDNANLEIDQEFNKGAVIGQLRHGSFTGDLVGNCGWAVQAENNWHLHWGFIMTEDGRFQAEGCILNHGTLTELAYFQCGDQKVGVNEPLTHNGNITDVLDDGTVGMHILPGSESSIPSFYTLLQSGLGGMFDTFVGNVLPEHDTPASFFLPILNGVKVVFRIVTVLVMGYLNLLPAITFIGVAILINTGLSAIFLVGTILRIIKALPFV